jgi:hypothetical protein
MVAALVGRGNSVPPVPPEMDPGSPWSLGPTGGYLPDPASTR